MGDELQELRRDFHKIYYEQVAAILLQCEDLRKEQLWSTLLVAGLFGILALACAGYSGYLFHIQTFNDNLSMSMIGAVICCGVVIYVLISNNKSFSRKLKKRCMRKILSTFENMQWQDENNNLISTNELITSDLFSNFTHCKTYDGFSGNYKGVHYKISELYLYFLAGSRKRKIYYPVFKGVAMNFSANKLIKNKTIVTSKGDLHIKGRQWFILIGIIYFLPLFVLGFDTPMLPWILAICTGVLLLIFLCTKRNQEKLGEIQLEDPVFSKKYRVYSSDEVESRYLVTPAFMERFNNVKTAFGARKIKCSFYNKDIMFAISTNKNLFELGDLFHSLKNPKKIMRFFDEITSILMLVDYFKLDEHTKI